MRPPKRNPGKSRVSRVALLAIAACGVGRIEGFTVPATGHGPVRNGVQAALSGGRIPSWFGRTKVLSAT
eukprot:6836-Heterococcus_DN1.PRE.1